MYPVTNNLSELNTNLASSNKIEIRVTKDKDKVEKYFNKSTVLSFGYTSELQIKNNYLFVLIQKLFLYFHFLTIQKIP